MFKYIKFLLASVSFWLLFSCNTTNNKPLSITFSADSSQIVISDINKAGLLQIKNNIYTDSAYQKLVSVLQTPADDDSTSMEIEWKGKLSLAGDKLLFTPDSPFVKGKTYLIESILRAQFATAEDMLKDDVGVQVKPQHQLLKR